MPVFHYSASEASGRLASGTMTALSRVDAMRSLRAKGLKPVSVAEGAGGAVWTLLNRDLAGAFPKRGDAALGFTREFALLLSAKVNPVTALEIMATGGAEDGGAPVAALLDAVRGGATLADAMRRHPTVFGADYVGLVRAGQASGALPQVMRQIAAQLERRAALRSKIGGAMVYPAILLAMSVATIVVLVTVVLPSFEPMFARAGADLPFATRIVMGLGDFVAANGSIIMLLLLLAAGLGWSAWRDPARRARIDRRLLGIPVIGGLILHAELARGFRSLATMGGGGVDLRSALGIAADGAGNAVVRATFADATAAVARGRRLSDALGDEPALPPAIARLVRVGEESGTLPEVLDKLADLEEARLDAGLSRFTALLTPLMTLVVGAIVALILFAILSAVLSVNDLVLS